MTEELYSFEADTSRRDVSATLRSIVDGLDDADVLRFQFDEDTATVALADSVSIELEVEREPSDDDADDEAEIELKIELEWTEPPATTDRLSEKAESDQTDSESERPTVRTIDGIESADEGDRPQPEAEESLGTFQLFEDRAGEWRWRLVHRNGNIIATSGEGYTTKQNAKKGIRSVLQNAPGADVTE